MLGLRRRCRLVLAGLQDVGAAQRFRALALFILRMMIAQAALVTPEALVDPVGRDVEGGVGLVRVRLAAHEDAPADMDLQVALDEVSFAREHHVSLEGVAEIFLRDILDRRLRVAAQRVAHVDLLASDVHSRTLNRFQTTRGFWLPRLAGCPKRQTLGARVQRVKPAVPRVRTSRVRSAASSRGAVAPRRECAWPRDISPPCASRYRRRP